MFSYYYNHHKAELQALMKIFDATQLQDCPFRCRSASDPELGYDRFDLEASTSPELIVEYLNKLHA